MFKKPLVNYSQPGKRRVDVAVGASPTETTWRRLAAWQTDFLKARNDAIMSIKRAFDEADITIPFPIRTLDFGIVGGQRLSETVLRVAQARGEERSGKAD